MLCSGLMTNDGPACPIKPTKRQGLVVFSWLDALLTHRIDTLYRSRYLLGIYDACRALVIC